MLTATESPSNSDEPAAIVAVHAAWVTLGHAGPISFGSFVKVLAPYSDADR